MPVHSLEGLFKWLRHEEWREPFEDILARHLEPACRNADIEVDEIASVLGTDTYMNLWGCAFEDFLSREFEDGRSFVDDYLKRRGWKESAANRAYIAGLKSSVMSLHEVSDIVPGQSFRARDLVQGGEPVLVSERTATASLKNWDRIGARMVRVGDKVVLGGGVLLFQFDTSERLLEMLRRALAKTGRELRAIVEEAGDKLDEGTIEQALNEKVLLQSAAPLFATLWLSDALDMVLNPTMPEVRNTDGDVLLLCTVRWPFAPSASDEEIEAKLDAIVELRKESATFWNWLQRAPARKRRDRKPSAMRVHSYSVTLEDGSTVLGSIELRDRSVLLSANSLERAKRGEALITSALGDMVRAPLTETQSPAQALAVRDSHPSEAPEALQLPAEEQTRIVHAFLDEHYRRTLDEPVGMLGGKTPRQAARSRAGRAKVVSWLKYLENSTARHHVPDDPMASYDLGWLWQELGVADERQ